LTAGVSSTPRSKNETDSSKSFSNWNRKRAAVVETLETTTPLPAQRVEKRWNKGVKRMILIQAVSKYAKAERLVSKLDDVAMSWVDQLESDGWLVSFTNLPSHIDTHERYAAVLLDQFLDMYLPETSTHN
jgi:hypothetical protein